MYKYSKEGTVSTTDGKTHGIYKGHHRYEQVQDWLDQGNTIEPYKTPEELEYDAEQDLLLSNLLARMSELEEVKSAEGLNDLTVSEARAWISNKMDKPGTVQEKLEDIKSILLKMVPYILEYKI